MKQHWLLFFPLVITGCNTQSQNLNVTSDTVPKQQIQTIVNNINKMYPDASKELKEHAANVVVRAIENLVFVKGGTFDMGDFKAPCEIPSRTRNRIDWTPDANCLASPSSVATGAQYLHKVTLDSYSISKYETSFMNMEWMRQINKLPFAMDNFKTGKVIARNSSEYARRMEIFKHKAAPTKKWQEAKDYCLWLGKISSLDFNLPTEAQWEYAARNRGKHVYYATNTGYSQLANSYYYDPEIGKFIEYKKDEINSPKGLTNLGAFPPNPLGIYGMSNQVTEWVNDWYSAEYYQNSPEKNPQGPNSGTQKVARDGGGQTMTFDRIKESPLQKHYHTRLSFRCAKN
ncbi:formylglycine-generating enzyme family protein [Vibrio salinus]|uniref:formylglycine-generating enzyme family protein n=1 Tax=Vibrio salinus TaxID=2899784 RepID=UPI001E5AA808|nr:SUMF1/EgtB/PvdO family nonheme iron enzyme [Vibrio salinus]MCE0495088.1 formylglycine-generating enzyme family protein [Vibrio salinus]